MVGPEYEEYWKLVAQAKLLEGKGKAFKHASRKANARLASWIRGEQDIKHRNLMREAQSLRDRMRLAAKTAAERGEQEVEVEGEDGKTLPQQDVAAQIENAKIPTQQPDAFNLTTFLEELRIPSDSERMLKKTEEEIHRLQDRITRHRQRKPSATESQAQRLSESPTTSADDVPVNSNGTTDEELRGDEKTGTHADQQWEKVHGISQLLEKYKQQFEETREQARKREVIRKRKEEVLVRKRILLKELWELEEKEREAMPVAARSKGLRHFIGAHVSIAKGVHNSVQNALHIGGNAFALFLKSQRKWESPPMQEEHATLFHGLCSDHDYRYGSSNWILRISTLVS